MKGDAEYRSVQVRRVHEGAACRRQGRGVIIVIPIGHGRIVGFGKCTAADWAPTCFCCGLPETVLCSARAHTHTHTLGLCCWQPLLSNACLPAKKQVYDPSAERLACLSLEHCTTFPLLRVEVRTPPLRNDRLPQRLCRSFENACTQNAQAKGLLTLCASTSHRLAAYVRDCLCWPNHELFTASHSPSSWGHCCHSSQPVVFYCRPCLSGFWA